MDEYLKYFLHALLRHRLLTLTDGVTMFALINDAFGRERVDDPEQVLQLISTMNSALRPFGFEIMRPFDHETGEAFLALVNVQNDDISLLATEFSSLQMEFLKKLLEFMVTKTKGTFVVDITTALNLVADKKKEMEVFLGNLVRAKWLLRDAEYFAEFIASYRALFTVGFRMTEIRCSPRLLCELRGYLRMEYPQYIFDCAICKDLVTIVNAIILFISPFLLTASSGMVLRPI